MYSAQDIATPLPPQETTQQSSYSLEEIAQAVLAYVEPLFAWLIDNNPANVNDTLKHVLKIESLPFAPDATAIRRHVDLLIQKGDKRSLQEILNRFKFNSNANNYTTNPLFVSAIKKHFNK